MTGFCNSPVEMSPKSAFFLRVLADTAATVTPSPLANGYGNRAEGTDPGDGHERSDDTVQNDELVQTPLEVHSAEGVYIHLKDGRRLLEGVSPSVLGHCPPVLGDGGKAFHSHGELLACPEARELEGWVTDRSYGAFAETMVFPSGDEAMEAAIKLCRLYWIAQGQGDRRTEIIARTPSWHGSSLGCLALGDSPLRSTPYLPLFPLTTSLHRHPSPLLWVPTRQPPYAYTQTLASSLDNLLASLDPFRVLAFLGETLPVTSMGVAPPPKGYWPAVASVLRRKGVLVIMDERESGGGRTGGWWVWKEDDGGGEGVKPDICVTTIGGVGVLAVGEKVRKGCVGWKRLLRDREQGWSMGSRCREALSMVRTVEKEGLLERVKSLGGQLRDELRRQLGDEKVVAEIRGIGLLLGIEFAVSSTMRPRFAQRVQRKCLENGLIAKGLSGTIDGWRGECLMLAPASVISSEQISEMVDIVATSVKACAEDL